MANASRSVEARSHRRAARNERVLAPRLRPRARKPAVEEDSRERIRAAALTLFGQYGYEGLSLQQIADAAGLHKSTLFHHYRSKLEIALDAFGHVLSGVVSRMQMLSEDPVRLEQLLDCSDELTEWFCTRPEAARLLMSFINAPVASELRVPVPSLTATLELQLFGTLAAWLDRALKSGVIRPVNRRQAIVNLIGLALFYPAVAHDLAGGRVAGPNAFSPRSRQIRKEELRAMLTRMLAPSA